MPEETDILNFLRLLSAELYFLWENRDSDH